MGRHVTLIPGSGKTFGHRNVEVELWALSGGPQGDFRGEREGFRRGEDTGGRGTLARFDFGRGAWAPVTGGDGCQAGGLGEVIMSLVVIGAAGSAEPWGAMPLALAQ